MPKIIKYSKTLASVLKAKPGDLLEDGFQTQQVIDDVRFVYSFKFDGIFNGNDTLDLKCYVSYKKHLSSSYKEESDYKPTSARTGDANTICAIGLPEFMRAFDYYGDYLGYELVGKNTDTVNPSSFPVTSTPQGIFFTNNNDRFHKHFHCFTTLPVQSLSVRSVNLTGRELQDFTNLMKFYSVGGVFVTEKSNGNSSRYTAAKKLWLAYKDASWFSVLTTPEERETLRRLLTDNTMENLALKARYDNMKQYEGYQKRSEQEFEAFLRNVEY